MAPVADSSLFDMIRIPEAIEKLAFPATEHGRRDNRRLRHHHHHQDEGSVAVDILETPKAYTFFLDVPGLSKSDIQVTVEDESVLVVRSSGKREREGGEEKEEGCKYIRLEREGASPRFLRKFRLPEHSDIGKIAARCENGELKVTVGKRPPPEASKARAVEVAVA